MGKLLVLLKSHKSEIFGLISITCLLFLFAISQRGEDLSQQFIDTIRTTKNRNEVIIIGIDDKSLQSIGAWPFDRKVFANLTKKLDAGEAKAIVYDILFLEPRHGDDEFKAELQTVHAPVIFASKIEKEKYLESFLNTKNNPNIFSALSNVTPDIDGKIRKYPLFTIQNGECVVGLGEEAFRVFTFKTKEPCEQKTSTYFRYPSHIVTYSLIDVLNGDIPSDAIKGKVVFIGSTSLDLEDHFVGLTGEKIPGVHVHASIFTSLLNKEGDTLLTDGEIFVLVLCVLLLTVVSFSYARSVLLQLGITLLLLLLVVGVSYLSFENHVILPTPILLLTVLVTGGYITFIRFLKERKKSEYVQALFGKYVHKDVLKQLLKSSDLLHFEGEKREVTVLFSDLRGFTTLSESLLPEELTRILNGYFSAMTPAILVEHGTIDKFIGDAIMAFWNAPLSVKDHSTRAVRSALKMQTALDEFNKVHNTTLKMGVGLHRGDVIVGNVGSQDRINYTILGDTVNLGSRVEGLTKKYGVVCIVTEAVKNVVHDKTILFRKLDVITVKGKAEHTLLYEAMYKTKEKEKICKLYEEGFELYFRGDFKEAKTIFETLAKKGDGPSSLLLSRLDSITDNKNWDGVWHFDEK